jgi:uncharacterized protein YggU (UPF0235/DUF167 family)
MRNVTRGAFAERAVAGAEFAVRAVPGAGRVALEPEGEGFRAAVTEPAVDGRATEAVRRLLARGLGVAPARLVLVRGATSRDKRFRLE